MTDTALILGASGRFGRHASDALAGAGWEIRRFDRARDDLAASARGAELIVFAANPPYPDWAREMPALTEAVISAAREAGATILFPGNVYVFGRDAPATLGADTPRRATNPLGRIRIDVERRLKESGVPVILIRAGDFIDTRPSGNWFDRVLTAKLDKGRLSYPGRTDVPHAWAYLPDLARAAAMLADRRDTLARVEEVPFPGYTLTGAELAAALGRVTGQKVRPARMAWWPLQLARPFWRMAAPLLEMRYLWDMPHALDGARLAALLPEFAATPLDEALSAAVGHQIHPDKAVA